MAKKKTYKTIEKGNELNDSLIPYTEKKSIVIFKSFEEQEEYNRVQMAKLSPLERLQQLRKMINVAYGMYGYNPDNLPTKHKLTIL
jgi:hypothetical protein